MVKLCCLVTVLFFNLSVWGKINLDISSSNPKYKKFSYKVSPTWQTQKTDKFFSLKIRLAWPNEYNVKSIENLENHPSIIKKAKIKKNKAFLYVRQHISKFKVTLNNNQTFNLMIKTKPSSKNYFVNNSCARYSINLILKTKKNSSPYYAGVNCYLLSSLLKAKKSKNKKKKNAKTKKEDLKKDSKVSSKEEKNKENTKKKSKKDDKKKNKKDSKKETKNKEKLEDKLVLVFSTFIDANLDSNLYEISGKSESTRKFEFPFIKDAVSINGELGVIYWGKEKVETEIRFFNGYKYFLKKESEAKDSFHNNRHFGLGFNSLALSKTVALSTEVNKSENQGVFLIGEVSGTLWDTKLGYFATANALVSASDKENKMDYYDLMVAGSYWFYFGKATIGPLLGVRLVKSKSTASNFGADIQAPVAGLSFEWPLWGKNKIYLSLSFASVSGDEASGSEMNIHLMQDFEFWSMKYFLGFNMSNFNLESTVDQSKVEGNLTGLIFGINL